MEYGLAYCSVRLSSDKAAAVSSACSGIRLLPTTGFSGYFAADAAACEALEVCDFWEFGVG